LPKQYLRDKKTGNFVLDFLQMFWNYIDLSCCVILAIVYDTKLVSLILMWRLAKLNPKTKRILMSYSGYQPSYKFVRSKINEKKDLNVVVVSRNLALPGTL